MKRIINKILSFTGLELRRIQQPPFIRSSMHESLKWLAANGFKVDTILDVGASNGSWSMECMEFYPEAHYVLFEPQPVHSAALDVFANKNRQKISLIKKAVGASEGFTLFDAEDPFGGSLADKESENTIKVSLTTIDAAIQDTCAGSSCLLKLDTHGFEKSILEGSYSTLEKCEVLIIEAYNYRITKEALLFWELCAYLAEKGFRPVDLVDMLHRTYDNSLWQMDLIFVRDTWEGFDCTSYE